VAPDEKGLSEERWLAERCGLDGEARLPIEIFVLAAWQRVGGPRVARRG
jgi:hypothetical protein